eukprot:CAMPEP_0176273308 /NCGR_PEP_ID=MMETSP0121_2-20121125/46155_1 /TAXON_ID=160619 /ORGANISM="Kryptoperidinium foliaceum, Strain CCMP 1326" /LENGTH=232 /DNA_ID=CAMNT_0017613493 /DNA_START=184 /DNA_END=879 /DNA_ORIENTATION=-
MDREPRMWPGAGGDGVSAAEPGERLGRGPCARPSQRASKAHHVTAEASGPAHEANWSTGSPFDGRPGAASGMASCPRQSRRATSMPALHGRSSWPGSVSQRSKSCWLARESNCVETASIVGLSAGSIDAQFAPTLQQPASKSERPSGAGGASKSPRRNAAAMRFASRPSNGLMRRMMYGTRRPNEKMSTATSGMGGESSVTTSGAIHRREPPIGRSVPDSTLERPKSATLGR